MSARRGSLRFRVIRLAGRPGGTAGWGPRARQVLFFAGRVIALCTAGLIATTIGAQVWRLGSRSYELQQQITAVQSQNRRLQAESAALSKEIKLLQYPEYLVPLIHEQLGLSKAHEVFITVRTPPSAARHK